MQTRSVTAFIRRGFPWQATFFSVCCIIQLAAALNTARVTAQETSGEYQNLVGQGLHEFELGNFGEAKAFFQRAHQLHPSARTLRGLGMVSYELRHYVEAVDYFKQALASRERPLTSEMQREITELLHQALSFVTRLKLSVEPREAQVRVDTREAYRETDGTILLDPGAHELTLEAPGHEVVTRTIRSDGAEALALTIHLREASDPHVAGSLPAQPNPSAELPRDTSATNSGGSVGPYVLIGGSAALAIAGGVLLTIALNNKYAVENPDKTAADGPHYADYQSRADSVLPLSATGIGALCAGGVGVAAGLIWKLTSASSSEEKSPSTQLSMTGTAITFQSRFF
jgi:tetratricopeptide (TPR) repeat protein